MSDLSAVSPAFAAAFARYREGDFEPLRAYYSLVPGKQWGVCFACETPGWVAPSGLLGKLTCSDCEADIAANLGGAV
jgi:hypothetical protein